MQGIIILCVLVLMGRIFQLQIVDHEQYAPLSDRNSIRMDVVQPARGLILDRNGTILVDNQPTYSITVTPANFRMENLPLLAELLEMDEEVVLEGISEARSYSWFRKSRIFSEVSFDVFSAIEENLWRLPGIGNQIESKRNYPRDLRAAHSLGYLREASREEYERSDDILLGERIGKSGLELVYEDFLKGSRGTRYLQVNAYGQAVREHNNGNLNESPVRGSDIITTLDADLQELAETLMQNKTGGLVALDPNTGAVLSIVSAPQYDLTKLAGRMDQAYWQAINTDSLTPLFNRAISSRQPPGSTFKPFMGIFGLDIGLITPEMEIRSTGSYIRGRAYRDLADPGMYNLPKAITKSSNYYFFWMMDRIASNGLLNEWSQKMKDFGMGPTSNIDLPFERTGIMPDSTYMNRTFGANRWGVGDLMSLGVGQGMVSVSPLQMAVATSVIANGGYRVQPHLVSAIRHADNSMSYTNPERTRIEWIRPAYIETVEKGMVEAVRDGATNYYANVSDITIAGKTGTAQNPHGENHGWFIAYAPAENPQIAVAVLMENSGFGSSSASPIASLLIEHYLTGEIKRNHIYNHVMNFRPPRPEPETEEAP